MFSSYCYVKICSRLELRGEKLYTCQVSSRLGGRLSSTLQKTATRLRRWIHGYLAKLRYYLLWKRYDIKQRSEPYRRTNVLRQPISACFGSSMGSAVRHGQITNPYSQIIFSFFFTIFSQRIHRKMAILCANQCYLCGQRMRIRSICIK